MSNISQDTLRPSFSSDPAPLQVRWVLPGKPLSVSSSLLPWSSTLLDNTAIGRDPLGTIWLCTPDHEADDGGEPLLAPWVGATEIETPGQFA